VICELEVLAAVSLFTDPVTWHESASASSPPMGDAGLEDFFVEVGVFHDDYLEAAVQMVDRVGDGLVGTEKGGPVCFAFGM
jgi:hypothetical protein